MFKRLFTAAILFGLAGTAPPAAHAETFCGPRESIVERLEETYAEALSALGYQSDSQVVEVWSSKKTGSWTMLMTRADGVSCVVASGSGWSQEFMTRMMSGIKG